MFSPITCSKRSSQQQLTLADATSDDQSVCLNSLNNGIRSNLLYRLAKRDWHDASSDHKDNFVYECKIL